MTTKTDFHAIMELKEKYTPAQHGIGLSSSYLTNCTEAS